MKTETEDSVPLENQEEYCDYLRDRDRIQNERDEEERAWQEAIEEAHLNP